MAEARGLRAARNGERAPGVALSYPQDGGHKTGGPGYTAEPGLGASVAAGAGVLLFIAHLPPHIRANLAPYP